MSFPLLLKEYLIEDQPISLFEPAKEAITNSYRSGEIDFPYWSQVWPAAIGMAQFLSRYAGYIANKKVLELGAGLGLPAIVASYHAAAVITSDYVPEAVAAMQQTVVYHQLQNVAVRLLDWTALPDNLTADVLLLSDVSYDAQLFALQEKLIRQFLQTGTTVIISTPQRLSAREALIPLLSFCKQQEEMLIIQQQQEVTISIFVLQQ